MTRVPGEQPALHVMINLFQLIDLVAQITTAMTFIHALLYVATYPEDVEQLREEILEVTTIEGFSKKSLDKMPKLDSFLHETMRLSGISNGKEISSKLILQLTRYLCRNSQSCGPTGLYLF